MPFLPFDRVTLVVPGTLEAAQQRLQAGVGKLSFNVFAGRIKEPFLGTVRPDGFRIRRNITYRNSWMPVLDGRITQEGHHRPAWKAFNTNVGSSGDVVIWHETYMISAGSYENIYGNMPPFGLGKVGTLHPATGGGVSARDRFKAGEKPS